jgi:hypothetical protein
MPKTSFYSGTGITSEQADAIESSANAAAQSAADASTSEANAATSESNAASSAANALTSETNASSSAANAASSETNAATSETNAATSEANALASANAAQNLEITSASFDTTDGTLTLTKANSGTVTTDLDGRYADLTGATFTGDVDIEGNLNLRIDDYLILGDSLQDTVLLHSNQGFGLVSEGTELRLRAPTVKLMSQTDVFLLGEDDTNGNPKVSLNYNNSERLVTTSGGIDVTGNIAVSGTVDGVDIATLATETYVDTAVSNLVDSAPATLDTLNELASALGDDANFSTTVTNSIGTKWTEDATKISNWDTAYSWGDHDAVGYLTTHQDISGKANLSGADFTGNVNVQDGLLSANSGTQQPFFKVSTVAASGSAGVFVDGDIVVNGTVDGVDIATLGANAIVDGDFASEGLMKRDATSGSYSIVTDNSGDWNTAHGWGNHADAGYLTSFDITGKANLSGATFTGNVAIGLPPTGTQSLTVAGSSTLYGGVTGGLDVTGDITVSGTVDGVDIATLNSNALVDGDFTSNGFMKRTGAGTYTVDTSSYVSSSGGTFNGSVTVSGIPPSGQGVLTAHFLRGNTTTGGATTPVLDLEKNVTGMNGSGRFIEFNTKHHTTSSIVTRGHLGINQSSYNGTAVPYFSHNDGNCGLALAYSGSSSYNAVVPASTLGSVTSSNINLGHQYARWNGIYLKISPNVSSDREYKRDIEELSEAEKRVAVVCKGLIRKYRMKDAYEEKGESARLHVGIIAQDLQDAFTAEGLDAQRYGMFCSDTWHQATVTTEDEDGNVTTSVEDFELVEHAPEGATNITEITRLSVRYEELLAFIISTT